MTSPDDPFADGEEVCPISAAGRGSVQVSAEQVAEGQAVLAALTGQYLPRDDSTAKRVRGATVIAGGGGFPVVSRDYGGNTANFLFGWLGEQGAGFAYGEAGYSILMGPGGDKGKKTTAPGGDGLAWDAERQHLVIFDNKQSGAPGLVRGSTALNENLMETLNRYIKDVVSLNHPDRDVIAAKLEAVRSAFQSKNGSRLPSGVALEISNAGGFLEGIEPTLQDNFRENWNGVLDAEGNQVELGWRNMQPPQTLQSADEAAASFAVRSTPEIPMTSAVAVKDAVNEPGLNVSTSAPLAPALFGALPLIVNAITGSLDFLLPRLGVKSQSDRVIAQVVAQDVLPHIKENPADGALLMVTVHTTDYGVSDPWDTISSVLPFFATTQAEAHGQVLSRAMWSAVPQSGSEHIHEIFYWYKAGKIEPYFP